MCLGALQGCQHFHAGLDTWKMSIHPRQGWKEVVNFNFWVPGKRQEWGHKGSSPQ